jgi:hypothetical protein
MGAALLVAVLAGWFAVSAACQLRLAPLRAVRRRDPLGLIPRWNFFAPRPIVGDLLVQYRGWDAGGPGPWTDFDVPARRRLRDAVWPGGRRAKKAAYEAALRTSHHYRRHPDRPAAIVTSVPYLLLLGRSARLARSTGAAAVQFRIVRVTYRAQPARRTPVFRSAVHRT